MTLSDKVSPSLKAMATNTKAFDKAMDELEKGIRTFEKTQASLVKETSQLRAKMVDAQKAVKDAARDYKKYGDELSKSRLETAIQEQEALKSALNDSRMAMKENEKSFRSMVSTLRNGTGQIRNSGDGSAMSMMTNLATSGIGRLLGDSLSQVVASGLESALGQPMATAVNGAVSSALSGAAMGSIAGPVGAAIGGAVGLVSGGISGIVTMEAAKDDAMKSYVQTAVEDQLNAMDQTLTGGSATAGSREQSRLAFVQRFGSEEAADSYLEQVRTMARGTNYTYDEIVGYSKSLLNSYAPEDVFGVLQTLSDASAGLSLGESDVNVMIQGLARMRTTGKATQEYLNYFSERGVDVYSALSNATGADKSQIAQMVSGGKISGETAAQAILDYINETFGGLSANLANTYDAMVNNLNDAQAEIDAAMGQGYNEARKEGIQAQMDWLGGESGEAVSEAYAAIGAFKASLENQKEALIRQYVDEAMASDEYKTADAEGDAATMGRLIMEAKIKAQNEYNASEGAQLMLESEISMIQSVRDDTTLNSSYYDAGYRLGQEFSKGRLAAVSTQQSIADANLAYLSTMVPGLSGVSLTGYATGLERVPYDNFPALLHEGERVLTASEARNYNGGGTVNVTGNTFVVRQDSDVDDIAEAIAEKLYLTNMAGVM